MSEFQLRPMTASASKELTNHVSGKSLYDHPKRSHAEGGSSPAVMTSPAITIMFTIVAKPGQVDPGHGHWSPHLISLIHQFFVIFINKFFTREDNSVSSRVGNGDLLND